MEFCELSPKAAALSAWLLVKVSSEANAMFWCWQVVNQREFHFAAEMGNHNTCVFLQVVQWAFRKNPGGGGCGEDAKKSASDSSGPFREAVRDFSGGRRRMCGTTRLRAPFVSQIKMCSWIIMGTLEYRGHFFQAPSPNAVPSGAGVVRLLKCKMSSSKRPLLKELIDCFGLGALWW